jgi:hypothetical protein
VRRSRQQTQIYASLRPMRLLGPGPWGPEQLIQTATGQRHPTRRADGKSLETKVFELLEAAQAELIER